MRLTSVALLFAATAIAKELPGSLWDWEIYGFNSTCPTDLESKEFYDHHRDNAVTFGDKGESKNCEAWLPPADWDYDQHLLVMRGFEGNDMELEIYGHGGCEKDTQINKIYTDGCTVVPSDTPLEWYSVRKRT
ncbi:hypothetical protein BDW42DRAFT_161403 [Aspergillus taichungensis]|uniref:Uncharacterized protein n=1 Tax=Aspergillus taichungensis TaxID=482145 RepID=A0A2J5I4X2_9EURO|nr:hypothetical protein BDW42DRAFT_161403 [Aspergillus taichungensis]